MFSITVMSGNTRLPSGTRVMPLDTISGVSMPNSSVPSNWMEPAEAFTSPAMARRVVLLPAPLAPMRVTMDFSGTSKLIPFTASIPP